MILEIQILSFVVSYFYGIFFYFMLKLNSIILFSAHMFLRIVGSLLFVMFHTLLYFLILLKINYGYVHLYFFLFILLGYITCKVLDKKFVKNKKI